MSEENKKPKVVFMPGAFDNFDGTQEELDALVKEIEESVINGTIFENSQPIDVYDMDNMTDEEIELFADLLYREQTQRTLQ